jgi:CheY-like chemotaxis protein
MPEGGQIQLSGKNINVDETFIQMQPSLKLGPHLLITVEDSGVGIDSEIIEKIFDPFFSTKNPGLGTGLGLHIAQTIVKSMQGEITVKSTKGKGSTFKIILPAITEKSPSVPITTDPLANCPKGDGELILIVDDEATFLQVAQDLLVNSGYKVISALNGMEALNLYHRHEKDIKLVLTDLLMPVMDGFTFIRTLSKFERYIPIIAITGADTKDKMDELNRLGIRGFLEKPFTTESLLSTTHRVLAACKKMQN